MRDGRGLRRLLHRARLRRLEGAGRTRRTLRSPAGFTLYEMIVAVLLAGIALHPLVSTLSSNSRITADRELRTGAAAVLRNEVALLSAAGPAALPSTRTYRARPDGRADSAGLYRVRTERRVRCGIGGSVSEGAATPAAAGCGTGDFVADYTVTVSFLRAAGARDSGTVSSSVSVPASAPPGALGDVP